MLPTMLQSEVLPPLEKIRVTPDGRRCDDAKDIVLPQQPDGLGEPLSPDVSMCEMIGNIEEPQSSPSADLRSPRDTPRSRTSVVSCSSKSSNFAPGARRPSILSRLSGFSPGRMSFRSLVSSQTTSSRGSIMQKVMTTITSLGVQSIDTQLGDNPAQEPSQASEGGKCCSLAGAFGTSLAVPTIACGAMWLIFEVAEDVQQARALAAVLLTALLVFGLTARRVLCHEILKPLEFVQKLTEIFDDPTNSHGSLHLLLQQKGFKASKIRDFAAMEGTFRSLAMATAMFMRYVPDTLVKSIFRGDDSAMRLHVMRRRVTIMFADIANFTSIAEQLKQEDLLFLLTRYLSVITKIIECYEGVVTEIMGDGLLVFWNTPDDVHQPEAKACASALAQQAAMEMLNKELATLDLQVTLAVRIGINTGRVLTGNLGSETKMKFGCIGDPMNLASRLEGLCKVYGTSVICSGRTFDALPEEAGFLCRELDLVQVKGKSEATRIFEVIDCSHAESYIAASRNSVTKAMAASTHALSRHALSQPDTFLERISQLTSSTSSEEPWTSQADTAGKPAFSHSKENRVKQYQTALRAYQRAKFRDCSSIVEALLEEMPDDKACQLLLERAQEGAQLSASELANWTGINILNEK
eukprot:TRINITY_DN27538_c0_g1_i2.p1 TRINITY_DN27538_c0_g1~~TRINITY_DN27538_c0_g1_i2.p1  ORF type:complete len:638 (+),score=147.09 TRINITY_DN27538_c0_g1_i2:77-1990(+)